MTKFYLSLSRYLTVLLLFVTSLAVAQSRTVVGKVTSSDDSSPLPGVNILIKGTSTGTVTDNNGNYSVSVGEGAVLLFSFVGFTTQEVAVGNQSVVNVVLQADILSLSEVVVVGYGTQTKREITGSIAKVDGEKLMAVQTPSFEAALQGRAAGVQVIQGSGIAGSGSVIRIRGISSVSANGDPLYVVDGIPITADNFLQQANWQNGAFNNNPLAAINPADIESVEILKDAAAAGIYGSRGSNGVILITTKRAKATAGKPTFNFSMNLGTSDPVAKPKFYNSKQWLQIRQEAWENDGNTGAVWLPGYTSATSSPEDRLAAYQLASTFDTDWWDLLTQTGFKQQYNLSTNFAYKKLSAYIGSSVSNTESYIKGNNLKRYSIRANLDYKFMDNLDVSLSTSFSRGVNQRVRVSYTGGLGDAMSVALPIYPVRDDQGNFWRNGANPVFDSQNFQGYTVDDRTINSLSLRYSPINKLKFTLSGSYDYLSQKNDIWESGLKRNDFRDTDGDDDPDTYFNYAERDLRNVNNYNINAIAEYDYEISSDQKLKFMVGSEYQQSVTSGSNNLIYKSPYVLSTIFKDEGTFDEEFKDEAAFEKINNDKWSFISYFLRANYSIRDKYYLQGTARVDGSSRFGSNNRYGFFPVISGAWLISEENFMSSLGFLSSLKLKAAYGIFGNAGIPSNQWVGTYVINPNPVYNGQPIRYPDKVNNPDLKWETTQSTDIGVEADMFAGKIGVELAYYLKNTKDVLLNLTIPNYNGFGNFYGNVGEIRNQGVEFTLNTVNFETPNFKWTTTFNIAYNTNKVLSLGGYTPDAVSGGTNDTRLVEGKPLGTNYLIRFSRVDPATGRPIYLDKDGYETFEYNEERDRVSVGDVLPDAVGSIGNTFTYRGFDLNFLFVFVIGGDIYDSSSKRQLSFLSDWNIREDLGDRWREPGDIAKYPKVTLTPSEHGNTKEWFNTDMFIHDASYLRLRSVTLGYNLPSAWISKFKLTNARVSVGGTNLLTFTKFPGLDPEVIRDFDNQTDRNMSPNITYLTPPQEKSFNFSINVTF
jgi:TonB-dependent starch-binding outer membrane protein SusC